ncbi:hypothetical protein BpHYR1_045814 [Brachionus plicatilis]|uniref:Uncharacterized protein n=1 Tax=Brachionus plicatilis TaxID=10195 RepID=A0A3M7SYX8_BRAPC|nr:hypothetical protein BpHYR1_045814 [Brachionus plicatilis]
MVGSWKFLDNSKYHLTAVRVLIFITHNKKLILLSDESKSNHNTDCATSSLFILFNGRIGALSGIFVLFNSVNLSSIRLTYLCTLHAWFRIHESIFEDLITNCKDAHRENHIYTNWSVLGRVKTLHRDHYSRSSIFFLFLRKPRRSLPDNLTKFVDKASLRIRI